MSKVNCQFEAVIGFTGIYDSNLWYLLRLLLDNDPCHVSKALKILGHEQLYGSRRLCEPWQQVTKNTGTTGIDQRTVAAFDGRSDDFLQSIHDKLEAGMYRFKPVHLAVYFHCTDAHIVWVQGRIGPSVIGHLISSIFNITRASTTTAPSL